MPELNYQGLPWVQGLNLPVDTRKGNGEPNLFVAGCSVSAGMFINIEQSYGSLLSEKTQMSMVLLANRSTSVDWAANQIISSDLRPGDVVVWGITAVHRLTWLTLGTDNNFQPVHCLPTMNPKFANFMGNSAYDLVKRFMVEAEQHHMLAAATKILQVKKVCEMSGARLLFGFLPYSGTDIVKQLTTAFTNDAGYVKIPYSTESPHWTDFGSDGAHPGPESHRLIAEAFFSKLKN